MEQGHTTVSRQNTVLSGFSAAIRFTRLISVPTAQEVPAGASEISFFMYSVDPFESAAVTTSLVHSG